MKRRRTIVSAVTVVILCAIAVVFAAVRRAAPAAAAYEIPTAKVKRGDLEMNVIATGELRASHTEVMTAPPIGGGSLEITRLLHTGTVVKKGDLVMEFDPSEQRYKLDQNRSELLQADQEITKAKADAAVTAAQDKVALLKARFDVRRAELDVQKNELVSAIDAHKNDLALEGAERVLAELDQDTKSRKASGQASIALAEEKRNKAKLAMDQAQHNIEKMQVTAPMDGLVALEKNERAAGGLFFGGMTLPEYRQGDKVDPGSNVGQVIDPTEMEVAAKVGELDRNNIKEGQSVDIVLDAFPGSVLHGTVKSLGAMNQRRFWEADTFAKFDITIALASKDSRLRPGLTAQVVIHGDPRKNVLYLPRQAVISKDSKRVVYVKNGSNFDPHDVKILAENESRAAVEGISVGAEIAMVDPTAPRKESPSASAMTSPAGGGQP
jgi:multidrug efflux pump subunit AcrA (membrane-fusion protein)